MKSICILTLLITLLASSALFSQTGVFKGLSPGVDRQTLWDQVANAGHTITSGYDSSYAPASVVGGIDSSVTFLFIQPKDIELGCIADLRTQYCYAHGKILAEFSNGKVEMLSFSSPHYYTYDSLHLRRYTEVLIAEIQKKYGKPTLRKQAIEKMVLAPAFQEMRNGIDIVYWIMPESDLTIRVYLISSKTEEGRMEAGAWVSFICISCEKEAKE